MAVAAPQRRRGSRGSRSSTENPARPQTLGVALDWIEAHCVIPDGFRKGRRFTLYENQVEFLGNHYLVKPDAPWIPDDPILGPAFVVSRSGIVAPQKYGKDPMEAAHCCLEGDGPALFGGWAGPDDGWSCAEHGCGCGWEYPYLPGEPMGMRWPTALIQVTAVSEDATSNTWDALRPMIELGPLADRLRTSEQFIRLPAGGRIDIVTASEQSRLGQRLTFASQGEAGLWTNQNGMIKLASTQNRGAAGMGGRNAWHSNAWDPARKSYAELEQLVPSTRIQFIRPPANLRFTNREDRRRILRIVYPEHVRRGHGGHVDLDSIETEAIGMIAKGEAAEAARFYGNIPTPGKGTAFDPARWAALARTANGGRCDCPPGTPHVLGFDGSKSGDHTGLVDTCVRCGRQRVLGHWDPAMYPNADGKGEIPRASVDSAVTAAFRDLRVVRFYPDPPYWREEVAGWVATHGADVVLKWETFRHRAMAYACRNYAQAIADGTLTHDGGPAFADHVGNAHRLELNERDEKGEHLWVVQKESPDSPRKIDLLMAAILSWEARMDAIADGVLNEDEYDSPYEHRGIAYA